MGMTTTTQFRVLDFDCPACASTVERALERTDGVDDVEVHYTTGRVAVTYDPAAADPSDLEATIADQGYTPEPA